MKRPGEIQREAEDSKMARDKNRPRAGRFTCEIFLEVASFFLYSVSILFSKGPLYFWRERCDNGSLSPQWIGTLAGGGRLGRHSAICLQIFSGNRHSQTSPLPGVFTHRVNEGRMPTKSARR